MLSAIEFPKDTNKIGVNCQVAPQGSLFWKIIATMGFILWLCSGCLATVNLHSGVVTLWFSPNLYIHGVSFHWNLRDKLYMLSVAMYRDFAWELNSSVHCVCVWKKSTKLEACMQWCGEVMSQPVINKYILFLSTTYFAVVRTVQRVGVPQFIFVDKAFLLHIFFISPSHLRCKCLFVKSNLILKLLKQRVTLEAFFPWTGGCLTVLGCV